MESKRAFSKQIRLGLAVLACVSLSTWALIQVRAGPPPKAPAGAGSESARATPKRDSDAPHPGGHGSKLIKDAHGLLVVEADPGVVVRANGEGAALASLKMSPGVAEIVHDGRGMVFVSDRRANRVVRIDPGDEDGEGLAELGAAAVREPYGLALTPDSEILLVTSVADHSLVALSTETLEQLWSIELAPEPRPVAVSDDGSLAAVGFLTSGAVAIVELAAEGRPVHWQPLDPADHVDIEIHEFGGGEKYHDWREVETRLLERRSRFRVPVETGRRYARNVTGLVFADGKLVVAHQVATPQLERVPSKDRGDAYGGGEREVEPIEQWVTVIERPGRLDASRSSREQHRSSAPRVLAHDPLSSTIYLGGFVDDRIEGVALGEEIEMRAFVAQPFVERPEQVERCGIDGLALDGDLLWAHCGLSRKLMALPRRLPVVWLRSTGPELAASARSELVRRGEKLFYLQSWKVSGGGLFCAACHPEGRSDHLSWRLGPEILQTPILAGRVQGTAPYKWNGSDRDLEASFRHTIERLGGFPDGITPDEYRALAAYIESFPAPITPTIDDPEASARGRAVFEDQGCDACHAGPLLTDAAQYEFDTRLARVDTPSLVGLAHSAPYFHDGSAQDLWALVSDRGSVHDMADTSGLSEAQRRDLVAYLEGL